MTTITPSTSKAYWPTAVAVVCLVAGALSGLLSVYADTRASCALWVVVALALIFGSGLLFGSGGQRGSAGSPYREDAGHNP